MTKPTEAFKVARIQNRPDIGIAGYKLTVLNSEALLEMLKSGLGHQVVKQLEPVLCTLATISIVVSTNSWESGERFIIESESGDKQVDVPSGVFAHLLLENTIALQSVLHGD